MSRKEFDFIKHSLFLAEEVLVNIRTPSGLRAMRYIYLAALLLDKMQRRKTGIKGY
jgi:hypothetical protein